MPHLVESDQLTSANTLSFVASYGTFLLASIVFSLLAAVAAWLGSFNGLSALRVDQEALALAVDACTFLVSAVIVFRLPIPRDDRRGSRRTDLGERVRDIREGLRFIAREPRVRIALWGGGLITLAAGWWARYSIGHARRMQRAGTNPGPAGAGAT